MKLYGWVGLLILVASEVCLFHKIEPFYSWFYCFAWWSYILLADNLLLRLTGTSLLTTRRRELWTMLPFSVFIWLMFEAYNLVIRNWAYTGVPSEMWLRWPGYALAFATVLPGVFVTAELARLLLFGGTGGDVSASAKLPQGARLYPPPSRFFQVTGAALCVTPLLWPHYFFPAVWIGPIFLLDPVLEKFGLRSLSLSIASGDRRRAWSLLAGGLACGAMWEFWNFWAASKWVYTVPFFGDLKVFEMPLLGFLGFPPFALECWIIYHLLRALTLRLHTKGARIGFWAAVATFCLVMFHAMDGSTVLRFESLTEGFPLCRPV